MKYIKTIMTFIMLAGASCIHTAERSEEIAQSVSFEELCTLITQGHTSIDEQLIQSELGYVRDQHDKTYPIDQKPIPGKTLKNVYLNTINLSKDHINKLVGKPIILTRLDTSFWQWLDSLKGKNVHIHKIDLSDNALRGLPYLPEIPSVNLRNNQFTTIELPLAWKQGVDSILVVEDLDLTGNPLDKQKFLEEAIDAIVIVRYLLARGGLKIDPDLEKALKTSFKNLCPVIPITI